MNTTSLLRLAAAASLFASPTFDARACGLNWAWTLDEALEKAKEDNKLVLLFFTGSDWSPRSIALDKQVFERGEFSDVASSKFALHLADFPQRTRLAAQYEQANIALAERFKVRHFPTIVALMPDGTEYARHTYTHEDAVEMVGWLNHWDEGYRKERAASTQPKQASK